jgi:hypothetical protein
VQEARKKELNLMRLKWQSQEEKRYFNKYHNKEAIAKELMKKIIP